MPVRTEDTSCPFCKESNREQVGIDGVLLPPHDPAIAQKLHRRYSVVNKKDLLDFLGFLSQHIQDVDLHIHFRELADFAESQSVLDWGACEGRYVEAIIHLCVDAHLSRCEYGEVSSCNQLHVKVDGFPFMTYSRSWRCVECRQTADCIKDDQTEEEAVRRIGDCRGVGNPIKACTVSLHMAPGRVWPNLQRRRCGFCQCRMLDVDEFTMGRANLLNSYHQYGTCVCLFSCIDE